MTTAVQFANGETYVNETIWHDAIARGEVTLLKGKDAEKALNDYRRAKLLEVIKPGATLTTVCTHSSSNGTSARFKVFIPAVSPEGRVYIREITKAVADLAGFRINRDHEIVMGGCGYSKSFSIGYSLGRTLWPNGTPEPHGMRNGVPDSDGGYAINVSGH